MELGLMSYPLEKRGLCEGLGLRWGHLGASTDYETVKQYHRYIELGITPLAFVCFDPLELRDPEFIEQMAANLKLCALTLPARHYEIWPEPGCPHITKGHLDMPGYAEVLEAAYIAIKSVDAAIQVWNGGIGQHGTLWTTEPFIRAVAEFTDVINLHPFLFHPSATIVLDKIGGLVSDVQDVLESMGISKPVVVSEWGYPSAETGTVYASWVDRGGIGGTTEEAQAEIVEGVLDMFEGIGCPVFHFAILQDMNDRHWGCHTGFLREDGSEKPVCDIVRNWLRKRG